MSKGLEALKKIDYTICLNINNGTLKFGLDKYDNCDCKDFEEFGECYAVIEKALKDYEWLKSIIPMEAMFMWNLSADDKIRLLEIMGVKYE